MDCFPIASDLDGVSRELHPPPFKIPKTSGDNVNDTSTRLGMAYERLLAFEAVDLSQLRELYKRRLDRADSQNNQARVNQYSNLVRVCDKRREAALDIKKAIYYELALAKREAGQWANCPPKPQRTLQEWDVLLDSMA